MTTNYDLILESLLLHETQTLRADAGLSLRFVTKVDEGDVRIPDVRHEIPIRKLHGSVDLFTVDSQPVGWQEDGHDGEWLPAVHRDSKPRLIQADRLDKAQYAAGRLAVLQVNSMLKLRRRHGESLTPAIAPPSFYKANRYDWLLHTWHDVHEVMVKAREIIFVGYSMPPTDGHLRGLLATSLALRNQPPVVRVLDASGSVVKRFAEAFRITDGERLTHAKFESAIAMKTLARWLDAASA